MKDKTDARDLVEQIRSLRRAVQQCIAKLGYEPCDCETLDKTEELLSSVAYFCGFDKSLAEIELNALAHAKYLESRHDNRDAGTEHKRKLYTTFVAARDVWEVIRELLELAQNQ